MSSPLPPNEIKRLDALLRYRILDTPPEQNFDDFAFLASILCEAPIAMMTLVDAERQWFKAAVGIDARETPREHAFCAHAILGDSMMVVEDAMADERFSQNPLVTSAPHIRFYAGAPLIDGEGHAVGTLCVIDRHPRRLTEVQRKALLALARQAISQLELRRTSADLAQALTDIHTLRGLLPICSHCKGIRNDVGCWQDIEAYVRTHSDAKFSHGICPTCLKEHHPEVYEALAAEGKM